MRAASERRCDPSCMEVTGHRKPKPRARGPHFRPPQRPIEGVAVCTGPCHKQSLLAPAGLPESLPVRQGSGSSEAPRVRDQPQDLFTISSSNSKQHSRIIHFCFHPSVCGNLDSNAPVEAASKEDSACFPRVEVTRAPLQPQRLAKWYFLTGGL